MNLTLENCYVRSKTQLGSSKNYSKTIEFHHEQGMLSSNKNNNFKDWKKIYIKYCSGAGHQGYRSQPVKYKDSELYFRGHNITIEQFNSIEEKLGLFSKASQVIVSGSSAGGLAAFTWANYVGERVKNGKVWAIPDAGIFMDSYNHKLNKPAYKESFKNLMQLSNA